MMETYFQWKTDGKSYIAYQIVPTSVTFNDTERHSLVQGFSIAIPRPFMQYFSDFKWYSESRGSLVIGGLLVLAPGDEEGGDEQLEAAAAEEAGTFTI